MNISSCLVCPNKEYAYRSSAFELSVHHYIVHVTSDAYDQINYIVISVS